MTSLLKGHEEKQVKIKFWANSHALRVAGTAHPPTSTQHHSQIQKQKKIKKNTKHKQNSPLTQTNKQTNHYQ